MRWSPEQISGWLFEQGIKLSHERIYQMIWQDKRDGGIEQRRRSGLLLTRSPCFGADRLIHEETICWTARRREAGSRDGEHRQRSVAPRIYRHSPFVCTRSV